LAPRTVNGHLNLLSLIFASAQRAEKMRSNPVALVERPREPRKRKGWKILKPAEIARVERAFRDLVDDAEGEERSWREQARVIFLLLVDPGCRRGERFVHDQLELAGWDVRIADAQRAKGLAPLACKTDRIDAWVLAELARRDLIPEIWLPVPEVRGERERARFRLT
jgi:hypothetical protein